jgi:hypothetical protein
MSSRSSDTIPARIYPWWLLLVGFVIGVLLTFFVMYGRGQTVTVYRDRGLPDNLLRQATAMVHQATLTAQAGFLSSDPMLATATAIAVQAQPPAAPSDPIMLTATVIVQEASAARAGR